MPAFRCCAIFVTGSRCRLARSPGLFNLIAVIFVGGLGIVYANSGAALPCHQVPDKQQVVELAGVSTPS